MDTCAKLFNYGFNLVLTRVLNLQKMYKQTFPWYLWYLWQDKKKKKCIVVIQNVVHQNLIQ